ncbi:MAG: hypothetical protein PF689_07790 [Deltaproteobacteria bacterium]|nr:hypothetical protein [Deltaproteobacteria bacterium]
MENKIILSSLSISVYQNLPDNVREKERIYLALENQIVKIDPMIAAKIIYKKSFWILVKFSFLLFAIPFTMHILQEVKYRRSIIPLGVDSYYLPSAKVLHYASLGNDRMLADLVWVRSLVYFGTEINGRRRQTWIFDYMSTVVALDPYFEKAYAWAGVAMIYGGAIIDREAIMQSNYFYEKGIKKFPDNWEMLSSLGFNYAYELKPDSKELEKEYRQKAIRYFLKASKSPDAPSYVKSMAAAQLTKEGMRRMAVEFLKSSFVNAADAQEEEMLENRMKKVMNLKDIKKIKAEKENLDRLYQATLPFASETLFYLLGPESLEPHAHKNLMESDTMEH